MKLEAGVVDIDRGERTSIQLLGIPKPLGVGIGDYGRIFQADVQFQNGKVMPVAFKVYGGGLVERSDDAMILRDNAFDRYRNFESLTPHTFDWGAIVPREPILLLPFQSRIFSLNDFERLKYPYARDCFSKEFQTRMVALRGKIKEITNIEVCVDILENIAETCSALGVLLHDAYFFSVEELGNARIQITPFIGDFDDSYKDLAQDKKESQLAQVGMKHLPRSEQDFLRINLYAARKLLLELLDVLMPPDTDDSFYKMNHVDIANRLGRNVIPL